MLLSRGRVQNVSWIWMTSSDNGVISQSPCFQGIISSKKKKITYFNDFTGFPDKVDTLLSFLNISISFTRAPWTWDNFHKTRHTII